MSGSHTMERIIGDLSALGVCGGNVLFVHSSFKSLGPVAGGAPTVIAALERAVGTEGLILMPSFNLVEKEQRAATWNIQTTPSTVGWLTEFFRTMPGTVRSDHYSHSVAARGRMAESFTGEHRSLEGMASPWDLAPWGKTFGAHSPFIKAYNANGKILMLGADYHSSTYCHIVETIYWNEQRLTNPTWPFIAFNRVMLGEYWDGLNRLRRDTVGDADSRCFSIREFVDTLLDAIRKEPRQWAGSWPEGAGG